MDAPAWEEIQTNYAAAVGRALRQLTELAAPIAGRLLVWRGPPGTGKTWAIRALARAWRDWCSVHVVLDPGRLLGSDPAYLIEMLTWSEDEEEDRWRLVVLEDSGDLVTRDSGGATSLAALLNVTDGLLGQGARVLFLITTNEPVGRLHPAIRRAGRCLSDIEFSPLSRSEVRSWLGRAGSEHEMTAQATLAELFALTGTGRADDFHALPEHPTFGFSRALAE